MTDAYPTCHMVHHMRCRSVFKYPGLFCLYLCVRTDIVHFHMIIVSVGLCALAALKFMGFANCNPVLGLSQKPSDTLQSPYLSLSI